MITEIKINTNTLLNPLPSITRGQVLIEGKRFLLNKEGQRRLYNNPCKKTQK